MKKIFAYILVALLTVSSCGIVSFAASAQQDSVISLLASIGVISGDSSGNYNLNKTVSRAEFATMLVKASPYKNQVTPMTSSPFKDVSYTHWASAYIKIAASKSLLSGYSDGNFRPDGAITIEQAANAALKLLGYTQADFAGAFPYAQMNLYESLKLSDHINAVTGSSITRQDAANLIYNLLNTSLKDDSKKYAQSLGYSLDDNGNINHVATLSENMSGPITIKSDAWYTGLGLAANNLILYKNGSSATLSEISTYDIAYYSKAMNTAWVYSKRVTGIYEKAAPNQDTLTSITVSGNTYSLESTAAFSALSSSGTLKIGQTITVLLGKDGKVADAVSGDTLQETAMLYVTSTGTKTFLDANDKEYTSFYLSGITPDGTALEYAIPSATWINAGDMVSIRFDDGKISASKASSTSLSGTVSADLMTIGSASVAATAKLYDTYKGSYTVTSLERIDGLTLSSGDVLYYKASGGKITELFFHNVTGDTLLYGIVTSAKSSSGDMSLSGSYTWLVSGVENSVNTQNKTYRVAVGPAVIYEENGQVTSIKNLDKVSGTISELTETYIKSGTKIYRMAPDVQIYRASDTSTYRLASMSDVIAAQASKNTTISFYSDNEPSAGGRIRVIVIR